MVDAEPGVPQHAGGDRDQRGDEHLAGGADLVAHHHQDRQRHGEVIGVALLVAERAGPQPGHVLKVPGAQDGGRADDRDRGRRRRQRTGADHVGVGGGHRRAVLVLRSSPTI